MARDASDENDPIDPAAENLDRAAILARRRRFIALALTGIAAAACKPTPRPQPCLNVWTPPPENATTGDAATDGPEEDTEGVQPATDEPTDEPKDEPKESGPGS